MVELVDTLVLGTSAFGRGGSTPSRGTRNERKIASRDNSNSNLLLEFDYHIDFYEGDNVDWFALTIGGLF